MKSFRLYLGNGKEATGAGCLLAFFSAAAMLPLGLPLAFAVGAATGFVFVAIPVAIGVLVFAAGAAVLRRLKVPLSRDEAGPRGGEGSFEEAWACGSQAFDGGDFAHARRCFERATALRPDDALCWESLACALCNTGRFEDSLRAFETARRLGHECATCHYNTWVACRRLGRLEEGLQALERSLQLEAGNAQGWFDLGLALGGFLGAVGGEVVSGGAVAVPMDGRHERAVTAFDRFLAAEPGHGGAWYCKAATLYTIGHSRAASENLIAAGYQPDILRQALTCVERALTLQPGSQEARALREDILAGLGEAEEPSRPGA
jgi:tetratricopeptide (TPR) repeat protein